MAVWQDLARRFQVEIFCGLFLESFNEGLSLSASTLQLLGERSIALDLDMYSRGEDWSRNGPLPPRFDPADRIALGVARAKGARGRA